MCKSSGERWLIHWVNEKSNGVKMKYIIAIVMMLNLSGCTASSWINAAGGILQGKDAYEKDARIKRINSANKAAGY